MRMLPSGLPDHVSDPECVSRFLTSSSQFNSTMVKPAAFLPHPVHRNSSVFRIGEDPEQLRKVWQETTSGERQLKAVAIVNVSEVRRAQLDVVAEEPPPKHANIEGWPWVESDPELQKARQKDLATQVASCAQLVVL
ncbi:hypothetical protein [Prosthecobacter sp.]|uniref:hypothetical protein n=1 Tax=Prosthecobacter sp. TaxID=1965333 RepID=UPI0025D5AB3F|nr:hypothetical protein [Prosthecobacter sp.]